MSMCEHNITFLLRPILVGTLIFSGVTKGALQTPRAFWPDKSSRLEIRRKAPTVRLVHTAYPNVVLTAGARLTSNQKLGTLSKHRDRRTFQYTTNSNSWHGITPLVSSRVEVELFLGKPIDSLRRTFIYENKTDKVRVLYSSSVCEQTEVGNWKVAKDTVLKLEVYPQKTLLVKTLNLDRSKFKRIRDAHPENWIHYFNLDDGISVDAQIRGGREEVMNLTYEPSSRQKDLRCSEKRDDIE